MEKIKQREIENAGRKVINNKNKWRKNINKITFLILIRINMIFKKAKILPKTITNGSDYNLLQ